MFKLIRFLRHYASLRWHRYMPTLPPVSLTAVASSRGICAPVLFRAGGCATLPSPHAGSSSPPGFRGIGPADPRLKRSSSRFRERIKRNLPQNPTLSGKPRKNVYKKSLWCRQTFTHEVNFAQYPGNRNADGHGTAGVAPGGFLGCECSKIGRTQCGSGGSQAGGLSLCRRAASPPFAARARQALICSATATVDAAARWSWIASAMCLSCSHGGWSERSGHCCAGADGVARKP